MFDFIFKNKNNVILISLIMVAVLIIVSAIVAISVYKKSIKPSEKKTNVNTSTATLSSQNQSHIGNNSDNISSQNAASSTIPDSSTPSSHTSENNSSTPYDNYEGEDYSSENSGTEINLEATLFKNRPEKNIKTFSIKNEFSVPSYQKKVFKDSKSGKELKYCLYLPEDYSTSKKYPVLLFMHGVGCVGNDYISATYGIKPVFENNGDIVKSAIIVAPQAPDSNGYWPIHQSFNDENGWGAIAMRLLLDIEKNYSCDTNRIYITGNSMGGHGTWNIIENYGDHFAAAIPICGWGNPLKANSLKNLPIWIYHGDADPTVNVESSRMMYNAIKNAGSTKIHYTELPGVQHDSWTQAYQNRDLMSWMFSQNKSTNKTSEYEKIPYLKIYDNNNKLIISEKDTSLISYITISDIDCLELKLTNDGAKKLEDAYKNSSGKTFTVYFGNVKIMSFTATKGSVNKTFYIPEVFDSYNYYDYIGKIDNT